MRRFRGWLIAGLAVGLGLGLGSSPAVSQADFSQLFEQLAPSVVWMTSPEQDDPRLVRPIGSGFITEVHPGQLGIVTACHVAIEGPQVTVDGQERRILRVFTNSSRSSAQGMLAAVSECDRVRDVAVLQPIQPLDEDENAYRTTDFPARLDDVERAWLAPDPPQVGEQAFVFGYPGPNAEFNATFGQVSSWLKRIYLRGDVTNYRASQDGGTCQVERTIHQDGVFVLTHVGQVQTSTFNRPQAGIPLKWGLSTLKKQAQDGDRVLARSNLGLPIPLPSSGIGFLGLSRPFAGTISVDDDSSTVRVDEVPWSGFEARQMQDTCRLIGFPTPIWERTTDQVLNIAAERDVFSIDAAVRGGSSGGPVFNASGQVIGLVVRGNVEGGHYSTTAADIRKVLSALE